jgi:hypothetical protein
MGRRVENSGRFDLYTEFVSAYGIVFGFGSSPLSTVTSLYTDHEAGKARLDPWTKPGFPFALSQFRHPTHCVIGCSHI